MGNELAMGTKIHTKLKEELTVGKLLGGGGQGNVYEVTYRGEKKALKWYNLNGMGARKEAFYTNINNNVLRRSPSPEFVWPIDITEWVNGTFGYVMDLIPPEYKEISDYMLVNARMESFKTIIDAALHIVSAFRILHNNGYSYQDLNDGNFFIEPKTGKVLICDNDNVAPNGTDTGILGKPRYMAPEIVLRKTKPDKLSDRFSMSIILYILFCLNHPLEGKRSLVPALTPELQEKLYGSEALFMMDPNDNRNAPDRVVHKNSLAIWPCLPGYMKDLFLKAFSQRAMTTPSARPTELEWLETLVRFRSDIVKCACGNEIFVQNGMPCKCDACMRMPKIPFRLEFPNYAIPGLAGSRIYRCQVDSCDAEEALEPMGQIVAKKDAPDTLGVRNRGKNSWNAITSKGTPKKVMPGDVIPLKDGIQFTIKGNATDAGTTVSIKANQ